MESAPLAAMAAALDASRSMVPNYNIWGNQDIREPFKQKRHLEAEDIRHPRWLDPPPPIRSRSELLQVRKRSTIPDPSYDFDGDGVIGSRDYFIGRCFDKDADGRLTAAERQQAEKAIMNGFMDKYVVGVEAQGPSRDGNMLRQKCGAIVTADNGAQASSAYYQPHFNAHRVPPHPTHTSLKMSRVAEMKGYGQAFGERLGALSVPLVQPKPPTAETAPRTCPISHIRERAEADHQAARLRGGLLPTNAPVNPEREHRGCGIGYDEAPFCATRSQLLETRKELHKKHCEELRSKGEEHFAPLSVRRAEREVMEFEFRRPEGVPKTFTTLKDDRRRERIEHNMTYFENPAVLPREYPRFSDRSDVPFWAKEGERAATADADPRSACLDKTTPVDIRMARTVSEPLLKVHERPWRHEERERHGTLPASAHELGATQALKKAEPGSKTVKRFTADYIEHGQGRNKPRLFDQIQPLSVGPRDLEPVEAQSSMELIRRNALDRRRAGGGKENPRCSRLLSANGDVSLITTAGPGAKVAKKSGGAAHNAPGDPTRRDSFMESTQGPRMFGYASLDATRSGGVRTGGFQRLDWIPRGPQQQDQQSSTMGGLNTSQMSSKPPQQTPTNRNDRRIGTKPHETGR